MTRPASISDLKQGSRQCIEAIHSDRVGDDGDANRLENVAR
jgi:hypothetical protein